MKYSSSESTRGLGGEALEGPRRDDGQGRDRSTGLDHHVRVGDRDVDVDLAVEDDQADVAPLIEGPLQLARLLDDDDREAGVDEFGADGLGFTGREGRRRRRDGPRDDS